MRWRLLTRLLRPAGSPASCRVLGLDSAPFTDDGIERDHEDNPNDQARRSPTGMAAGGPTL